VERKSLFTAPDAWSGGHYELLIEPSVGSSDKLCSLLKALWSFPSLDGCYLRNDCEPSAQARVQPCESGIPGHLYGIATLPTQTAVACGSHTMDYSGEEGVNAAHWVSLYLPLAGLSTAYPVGAYPFGPIDDVSEWKTQLDSFLTQIAQWTYSRVPFEFALVGFEVDWSALSREAIRLRGIPHERNDGILWSDGGELKWYPATRP
jgi:hypothetical protein